MGGGDGAQLFNRFHFNEDFAESVDSAFISFCNAIQDTVYKVCLQLVVESCMQVFSDAPQIIVATLDTAYFLMNALHSASSFPSRKKCSFGSVREGFLATLLVNVPPIA